MNQVIMYSSIEEEFVSSLSTQNSSKQEIKNYRSALKSWRENLGLTPDSTVGEELKAKFAQCCNKYRSSLLAAGIKPSTVASRLSRIRKVCSFYQENFDDLYLPGDFHSRLNNTLRSRGYNASEFVQTYLKGRITTQTFLLWCSGKRIPRRDKYDLIKDIESLLDMPFGTLLFRLGWRIPFTISRKKKRGNRKPGNTAGRYYIWTQQLDEEFQEMKKFHTSVIPPHGMSRSQRAVWTSSEGAENPTAGLNEDRLKLLAGFCFLPKDSPDPRMRGLGMKEEDITLGLLADVDVIEEFVSVFKLARSNGKYNSFHVGFLTFVTAALREGTGYIFQKPEFAGKLGLTITKEEWQEKCLAARRRLLDLKTAIVNMKRSGGSEYEMGRDPATPLAAILSLQRPLTVTLKMVEDMLADVDNLSLHIRVRACLFRDALLAALLQANPLRVKMFTIMKFGVNLVKEDDGSWWFKFKRNAFKNRRSLKSDYHVKLAPETWHLIERYQAEFRPQFNNADTSPYVFLTFMENPRKDAPVSTFHLSNIIRKRTKQYISGSPGFGGHSYRHIVATSIIKNSPSGIGMFLAAKVLHDRVDTVEENYAHLRTSDYIEPYNEFLSNMWKEVNADKDENSKKSDKSESDAAKNGGDK